MLCSIILCFSVVPFTRTCIAIDQGPIYIHADGSIDPSTSPISTTDNVTYNLTGNITSQADGVIIERNNTIIDGNGCSIKGSGWEYPGGYPKYWKGILLSLVNNVTITNTVIAGFHTGIYLSYSSHNNLSNNDISANLDGIWLNSSSYSIISGNHITSNEGDGIYLYNASTNNIVSNNKIIANTFDGIDVLFSDDNILTDNEVTANGWYGILLESSGNVLSGNVLSNNLANFGVFGFTLAPASNLTDFFNQIDTSNLVEDKPIYYLTNQSNIVISPEIYPDGIGFLGLVNCINVTVQGLDFMKNVQGLLLANTSESRIINNNFTGNLFDGLSLWDSSGNNLSDNNFTENVQGNGISLYNCSGNAVFRNDIKGHKGFGIQLDYSSDNILSGNKLEKSISLDYSSNNVLSGNDIGTDGHAHISLGSAYNNTMIGNNVTDTVYDGIDMRDSSTNEVTGNNVIAGENAVYLFRSLNNKIHHNNFASIDTEAYCENSTSIWDNGLEGNFWSDYNGTDSNQDGVGDTPYVIDANNTDHYPLMGTFKSFNVSVTPQVSEEVLVVSNSNIENVEFQQTYYPQNPWGLILWVSGQNETDRFCRVTFQNGLLNYSVYQVYVVGYPASSRIIESNGTHTTLYITYNEMPLRISILIIPEFPPFLILPLFMIATLLAIAIYKRRILTRTL